jgi:hypothetical protein
LGCPRNSVAPFETCFSRALSIPALSTRLSLEVTNCPTALKEIVMTKAKAKLDLSSNSNLASVIEPLASYICAAERPRKALQSALAVLLREVQQTNRAAVSHVTSLAESW